MELKIVYSKIAQRDLKEIYDYIRRDSQRYAIREVQLIRSAIKKLESKSLILGRKFEKFNDELCREMIFRNYRIVYDIHPNRYVNILSIHHHSRDISNNPAFDIED